MNLSHHSRRLALFGLILANLCWSGNALVARAFAGEIAPFTLSFWRWLLALVLLLPFVARPLWLHRQALCHAGWRLLLLGGLGIAGYNSLLYSAAQTTAAINISLVNTCLPLVTFIGAGLLLKEWPARRAWWGMLVAVAGLLVLISYGQWSRLASLSFNQGDLIMLLAVLVWALYTVLQRRWVSYLQPIPGLALLGAFILLGVPLILPFYLYELSQGETLAVNVANLSAIAYTAVFASLLAYLAWNHGIRVIGAARAALTNYLMPVFTALLGWLLLGESLQIYHWLGAAMIFGGLLLATRPGRGI
ncbi:DMT family transporter [Pseudomonas sp. NCCP-436]|uniref:DMT family transporter n=1 Tax=Pseudomonas sp. NCCP-436 TaxID=2842481 RepID=UPI001C7FDF05|nr:DMT family transporter [Pseudomonas sp. NCCP-436]GIZ13588.1 membrane protein [Pseudomonas sp. NCCP-436]